MNLDLAISRETVEGWAGDRCRAVFKRNLLQNWLATPTGRLTCDDITWERTELGIAVRVDGDVPWWELSPRDLARLRESV